MKGERPGNKEAWKSSRMEGKAAPGFEPGNNGFANRRLRPLGYAAGKAGGIVPEKRGFAREKARRVTGRCQDNEGSYLGYRNCAERCGKSVNFSGVDSL